MPYCKPRLISRPPFSRTTSYSGVETPRNLTTFRRITVREAITMPILVVYGCGTIDIGSCLCALPNWHFCQIGPDQSINQLDDSPPVIARHHQISAFPKHGDRIRDSHANTGTLEQGV